MKYREEDGYFTSTKAAEMIGISGVTIREWCRLHKIEHEVDHRGYRYFHIEEINKKQKMKRAIDARARERKRRRARKNNQSDAKYAGMVGVPENQNRGERRPDHHGDKPVEYAAGAVEAETGPSAPPSLQQGDAEGA